MKKRSACLSSQPTPSLADSGLVCLCVFLVGLLLIILPQNIAAQNFGSSTDPGRVWSWNSNPTALPEIGNDRLTVRPRDQSWSFGARGVSTRTGVLLRDVGSGSPAARAGLRAGDSVITVAGIQVGLVGARLYDLEEEINNRADSRGLVSLLVFNSTNSQLAPLDVQLAPSQTLLTGTITGLDRFRLPADATINVQITNLSRPHFVVRNGSVTLRPTFTSTSIPFSIAYDPTYIYADDLYSVRAYVTSAGNVIYFSERNPRVLTQGSPTEVQLRMTAADTNWSNPPSTGQPSLPVQPGQGTYTNTEAISRQIQTIYQRYLRRDPYYIEQAALMMDPRVDERLRSLPLDLMATQEFYDANGNNEAAWITRIFQEMAGRRPQPTELQNWQRRFAELRYSRATLLAQLQSQVPR